MSRPAVRVSRSQRRRPSATCDGSAFVTLLILIVAALFEPLFLDASLLSVDNRIVPPLRYHASVDEPRRAMNVVTTDINAFILPGTLDSLEQLRDGRVPLWNECQLLGQPQLASMGFATFYPTTALYAVFAPLRTLAITVALHLLLLGFGAFRLFTGKGLPWPAAMLGAVTMLFSGFVALHIHLPCFVMAYAWLPWLIDAGDRLLASPGRREIAVLGLLIGMCLLAGAPQISVLVIVATGVAFLVGWSSDRQPRGIVCAILAVLLGALLSALLTLPGIGLHAAA